MFLVGPVASHHALPHHPTLKTRTMTTTTTVSSSSSSSSSSQQQGDAGEAASSPQPAAPLPVLTSPRESTKPQLTSASRRQGCLAWGGGNVVTATDDAAKTPTHHHHKPPARRTRQTTRKATTRRDSHQGLPSAAAAARGSSSSFFFPGQQTVAQTTRASPRGGGPAPLPAAAAHTPPPSRANTRARGTEAAPPRIDNVVVVEESQHKPQKQEEAVMARRIARACPWLTSVPFIASDDPNDVEKTADAVAKHYSGEFCWAASFEPRFVAALMAHGFLTMAQRVDKDAYALLPKLHRERCALRFADRRVSKSVRRKANKLGVSCDLDFEGVVAGIQRQHGDECWLYPPLVDAFRDIFFSSRTKKKKSRRATIERRRRERSDQEDSSSSSSDSSASSSASCEDDSSTRSDDVVAMHTFECWSRDGRLVAGELGYAVGDVYTSLSGFSENGPSSSGSVQCAAAASWLQLSGFSLWDLGMELPYKLHMGATPVPRADFLRAVKRAREKTHGVCGGRALPVLNGGSSSSSSSSKGSHYHQTSTALVMPCGPVFAARDLIDGVFAPFRFCRRRPEETTTAEDDPQQASKHEMPESSSPKSDS